MNFLRSLILLIGALALSAFSFNSLSNLPRPSADSRSEMMYLPSGKGLQFISFGYRNTLAHFLWFHTNNYFGKQYRAGRDYKWLAHFCDLVTTLNPRNRDYYSFCGTILAWEANKTDASIKIYSRAIEAYPNDWLFYYLRGFVYAFFLKNDELSKADFIKSASLPNAHHMVARLASRKILASGSAQDAIEFLKDAIEMASDPSTKSILENRLRQIEAASPEVIKPIPWKQAPLATQQP